MPSKNQTSVVLSNKVKGIRDQFAPVYGLKNILSAGLLLFDRLSSAEQVKIVAEINSSDESAGKETHQAMQEIKKFLETEKAQPGTGYHLLTPEEQKILSEFRRYVEPEPEKKKHPKTAN